MNKTIPHTHIKFINFIFAAFLWLLGPCAPLATQLGIFGTAQVFAVDTSPGQDSSTANQDATTQTTITATTTQTSDSPPASDTITPDASTPGTTPIITYPDLIIKSINPGHEVTQDGITTKDVGELIELQNLTGAPLDLSNFSLRYIGSTIKKDSDGNPIMSTLYTFPEGSIMTGETLTLTQKSAPFADFADLLYSSTLAVKGDLYLFLGEEPIDHVCWRGGSSCEYGPFSTKESSTLIRDLETNQFITLSDCNIYTPQAVLGSVTSSSSSATATTTTSASATTTATTTTGTTTTNGTTTDTTSAAILPVCSITLDKSLGRVTLPASDSSDGESDSDPSDDESPEDTDLSTIIPAHCFDLEFSEIYTYYADLASDQFIELYNPSLSPVDLAGCSLKYKNKIYPLEEIIAADSYFAFQPSFTLTKNPTTSNTLTLLDSDGTVVDELVYPHGQKKSTSFAKFYDTTGAASWQITYARTPSLPNVYQEFQTCPAGKVINPTTGNCINDTTSSTTTTTCPDGKYLNPLTGRCKNLPTTTTLAACAEGYERNPETNRCRKITTTNEGADYALVPATGGSGTNSTTIFVAAGIIAIIVGIGIIYIVLQFRNEIVRAARKARQCLHDFRINGIPRKIGRHRDQDP